MFNYWVNFIMGVRGIKKGTKFSDEHKAKMSLAHVGKKHSPDSLEKMSRIKLGAGNPRWKGGVSKNTAHYRALRHKRNVLAGGEHSLYEWETLKAQYNWTCSSCKRQEPNIKLTKDHIIPLSKGGSHNIENIQPLCKQCNCRKHTKIIKF